MVASTGCCVPCHQDSPFATTSMRRSSQTGTSMFMSARRTLQATRAPASWHTLACPLERKGSAGSARDASTPEVAHAALWSPRGSGDRGQRTCAVPLAAAGEAVAAAIRGSVVMAPSSQMRCESAPRVGPGLRQQQRSRCGISVEEMKIKRVRMRASPARASRCCQPSRWSCPGRACSSESHAGASQPCSRRQAAA